MRSSNFGGWGGGVSIFILWQKMTSFEIMRIKLSWKFMAVSPFHLHAPVLGQWCVRMAKFSAACEICCIRNDWNPVQSLYFWEQIVLWMDIVLLKRTALEGSAKRCWNLGLLYPSVQSLYFVLFSIKCKSWCICRTVEALSTLSWRMPCQQEGISVQCQPPTCWQ